MEIGNNRWNDFQGKATEFLKKQGFYIVLGLCVLCIAIAAAVRFLPKGEKPVEEPAPSGMEASLSGGEQLADVLALPSPAPTATPLNVELAAPSPSPTPRPMAKAPGKAAPPVSGEIVWGFAVDQLLYSKTLDQWTTHEGVDIAAKPGTEVHAIRAGTVQSVYEDGALGVTVEVSHENGLVSRYANLQPSPPVREGQKVNSGATIGLVGSTAGSECALPEHVHFAIYLHGKAVDPMQYILLGN